MKRPINELNYPHYVCSRRNHNEKILIDPMFFIQHSEQVHFDQTKEINLRADQHLSWTPSSKFNSLECFLDANLNAEAVKKTLYSLDPKKLYPKLNLMLRNQNSRVLLDYYECKLESSLDYFRNRSLDSSEIKISIINVNPTNLVYGSRIKIKCENLKDHAFNVQWVRMGTMMPIKSYVLENILVIDRFESEDLGEYRCVAKNSMHSSCSIIFYDDGKHAIKYKINKNQTFKYQKNEPDDGDDSNDWTHEINLQPLNEKDASFSHIECFDTKSGLLVPFSRKLDNHSLKIDKFNFPKLLFYSKFHFENSTVYICKSSEHQASNKTEHAYKLKVDKHGNILIEYLGYKNELNGNNFSLDSIYKTYLSSEYEKTAFQSEDDDIDEQTNDLPVIKISFSDKFALAKGERVEIICDSDSANIEWHRVLSETDSTELLSHQKRIVISPVLLEDLGKYRCVASNSHGSSYRDAIITKQNDGIEYTIYGFVDNQLQYPANGYKDESIYDYEDSQFDLIAKHNQEEIVFKANNKNKNRLYEPTMLTIKSEPDRIRMGESIQFTCLKESESTEVIWSKEDHNKHFARNVIIKNEKLIIKKLNRNNFGLYSCAAYNEDYTIKTKVVYLIEQKENNILCQLKYFEAEPYLNSINHVRLDFYMDINNINENDKVEIKCSSFSPNANIEWYQRDESLGTNLLFTNNFRYYDTDLYRCKVIRNEGNLKREGSIAVQFKRKSKHKYEASIEL